MEQVCKDGFSYVREVCNVKTKTITLSFLWNLADNTPDDVDKPNLFSPQFYSNDLVEPSWYLRITHSKFFPDKRDVHLVMSARENPHVRCKFRCILFSKGNPILTADWSDPINFKANDASGILGFISLDLLYNAASTNLELRCDISYMINEYNFDMHKKMNKRKEIENELCRNLADTLSSEKFYDVTFSVDGADEFRAHKAILASRSVFFAAMFQNHKVDRFDISDLSGAAFKELLHFIYCADVPNLNKFVSDLLPAAQKYGLPILEHMCVQSLSENLSVKTAVATLILADEHNVLGLKLKTIDLINSNIGEVKKTKEWKDMTVSHCHLVFEAYEALGRRSTV